MTQEASFPTAVREWLAELDDMPTFRKGGFRYGAKQNKTVSDNVTNGLVRDIVRYGLRFFYEVTEECKTYGELQKKLNREWLANEAGKTRKKLQQRRVKEANEQFDGWCSDAADTATDSTTASEESSAVDSSETGQSTPRRRVTFLYPGCSVTAHNVRLAPNLHNIQGTLLETTQDNRLLIQFPHPYNKMSLRACNVFANE